VTAKAPLDPFVATGHPIHTRTLIIDVFRADDRHLRAEASIIDLRKCGFVPTGGDLQAAGIIHQMSIDAEVEVTTREITRFEPSQTVVAFEASDDTGGESCRDPIHRLRALEGERLGSNSPKLLAASFGGPLGCSHLLTLAQLLVATLPRALDVEAQYVQGGWDEREDGERIFKRAVMIDGYELYAEHEMEMALQLMDLHTTPRRRCRQSIYDRFSYQDEVRLLARIDTTNMNFKSIGVAERERDQQNRSSAPWLDLSPRVESLVGGFAMGGLGRRLISLLGGDPKVRTLLDTFLGLAPGMIQCLAAVAHRFSESPAALDEVRESDTPSVFSLGGMADSCYVWRKDSYLSKLRTGYPSEEGLSEGGIDQSSDAAREEPGN
jgi:hypothetical protein